MSHKRKPSIAWRDKIQNSGNHTRGVRKEFGMYIRMPMALPLPLVIHDIDLLTSKPSSISADELWAKGGGFAGVRDVFNEAACWSFGERLLKESCGDLADSFGRESCEATLRLRAVGIREPRPAREPNRNIVVVLQWQKFRTRT